MKTKISLTIIGVFNIIMSMVMAFAITDMIPSMLNTDSQEAARMVAMEAATDNAKKLKDDIEKKMNRARQALVTQELAELVGAAEA